MEQTSVDLAALGVECPPTEDELPCDDGMPMETQRHVMQLQLLMDPLKLFWADRQDAYVGGNMFVYFSLEQVGRVQLSCGEFRWLENRGTWSPFTTMSGGHAMRPHLVSSQLVILVLLWLCVMLPHLWPSPPHGLDGIVTMHSASQTGEFNVVESRR